MTSARAPIRVFRIITGLGQGGAEECLYKLTTALPPDRVASAVVSLTAGGVTKDRLETVGASVRELGVGRIPSPVDLLRVVREARRFAPDIVEGWLVHGNFVALLTHLALPGTTLVWNVRSSLADFRGEPIGTRWLLRITAALSRRVDTIIYNSQRAAIEHEQLGYAVETRRVIWNGFDTARFTPSAAARASARSSLGLAPDTPVVGHVGRWHAQKDYPTMLRAFANVRARCPEARLVLAGYGLDRGNPELVALAQRFGVEPHITMLGSVADPSTLYPAFDVFLLTSKTEGLPNAAGEAMACGVPCVTTDVGDCASLLGDTGIATSVGDAGAIADAVLSMLTDPEGTSARGAAARRRIEAEYSLEAMAAKFLSVYEPLIDRSAARSGRSARRSAGSGSRPDDATDLPAARPHASGTLRP